MSVNTPRHIAIIMDGNGRWAEQRQLSRSEGHRAGLEACRNIVKACAKQDIEVLSLFAFSSENWRRPDDEVNYLMGLFLLALGEYCDELEQHNVVLKFIGDRSQLAPELQQEIAKAEERTAKNTGLNLVIATNYGGQWDILQATKQLAEKVSQGDINLENITPELFQQHLSTGDLPAPDLFVRTSGETRISNFFLWQLSYTELYFSDVHWPDFSEEELEKAIASFQARDRRYGGIIK